MCWLPGEEAPFKDVYVINIKITNILHIPAFTVLFILWFGALKGLQLAKGRCYVYALIISIFYGVFLEVYQGFVPGRYPSLLDVVLNASGIWVGVLLNVIVEKRVFIHNNRSGHRSR
ncbi:MAG: VanZ family protein [Candidatus Hodarchaeales archaeon]